jgi:putative ABC transport system permease protein
MGTFLKLFQANRKSREVPFARYLVVLQFMGAFILVNVALVLHRQLYYMLHKDLGYSASNILNIEKYTQASGPSSTTLEHLGAFKHELLKNSYIKSVCLSSVTPGYYHHSNQVAWLDPAHKVETNTIWVDKDYTSVYGIKVLAGRVVDDPNKDEMMINESLMHAVGINNPDSIVGRDLYIDEAMMHHFKPGATKVVGVIKDFCQEPLTNSIAPAKFHAEDQNRGHYSIKFAPGHQEEVRAYAEKVFQEFYPKDRFNYTYLSDFLARQYKSDIQFEELMNITTGLSLIIACLGILGLISYSVEVQRKATAVRKILGSSTRNLMFLFLKKYLIYYSIAVLISFPLSILLVKSVLDNYAYQTGISYLVMLFPALAILVLISIIIGTQVLNASRENPVVALKAE